ncbi:MAG TPA: nitronate monooxygenase [Myxococcaceae bacterium]|nr:nitronate monooxygenase [Myxococcaceae bacterium]
MTPDRIETPLTRALGIRYPVIVAPMFLVSNAPLLEAAARAGAVGAVPSLNFREHVEFKRFLDEFPKELAFGVNLILKWGDRLEQDVQSVVGRKVPLVITSLGDPTQVVKAVHAYGGSVWCDVIGRKHAEKAAAGGADALIAVASGAGGHAGRISPFVLGPWLKEELKLPVVIAGGITTGRQLLAALALGGDAAYFGTRFIATPESAAPQAHKEAIVSAGPEDIEYTPDVTGVPANFLSHSLADFRAGGGKAWKEVFSAGQGVALIREVTPAGELVRRIVEEYAQALGQLAR